MNQIILNWWESKTIDEKTDLESSFVISASGLGVIIPTLIITLL